MPPWPYGRGLRQRLSSIGNLVCARRPRQLGEVTGDGIEAKGSAVS